MFNVGMLLVGAMILVQGLREHSRGVEVGFALGVAAAAIRSSGFSAFQRLTAPNRLGLVIRRFRPEVSPVWDASVALDIAFRILPLYVGDSRGLGRIQTDDSACVGRARQYTRMVGCVRNPSANSHLM